MARPLLVGPGDAAPDFTLRSARGGFVTLSDRFGKDRVLLAFVPMAFTRVCTAELCALSEDFSRFTDRGVVVYGISVDNTPSLAAWAERDGITVELLSDFKRTVCRTYGTLDEEAGFSRRAYVLLDRDGTVRWTHVEDTLDDRRDNAELLAALEADAA